MLIAPSEVSPLRARRVRKQKKGFAYNNLEADCPHLSPYVFAAVEVDVLSFTRRLGDSCHSDVESSRRLARFKRQLKKGPKLGRKALAQFVVLEAVKQGFYGIEKSR
jgi:hypothetical protein